ncbi:flavin monoamine oxidase family protein [Mangrovicella endophytica]|uniref:flavin monoamine oxidase family protein n=1 Tax=Mangrovicella endophytica TaxID=2066697 RepID=UPI000C9E1474|nr:NAD(P)/FAD-dependent oxidoreductase [Mangrovicella endophytica]
MSVPYDVAIIGAGAAGLAAAVRLARTPLKVVVLEARSRIGGRAHTTSMGGFALDQGCEWLHSADENLLVRPIEEAGFSIDRTRPAWGRQSGNRHFSEAEQDEFSNAFEAFDARLEAARLQPDQAAADFLEPGNRWNRLIDAVSSYYNGVEYDRVSVHDYGAYRDSGVNWRVREGYGTAIAALGSRAEVMLDCAVSRVEHGGASVRLVTTRGALEARTAIVAVPTPHLAEERIRFSPALPEKVAAAAGLPLGLANKAFLAVDRPALLPANGHVFGRPDRTDTASYHLRPAGQNYIGVFVGGRHARTLEAAGEGAIAEFAMAELEALFGSELAASLKPLGETAWGRDVHALGSYSHALPGHTEDRQRLAEPVGGRLYFAGEATHRTAFSTAHGAWESGFRAAEEALAGLGFTG